MPQLLHLLMGNYSRLVKQGRWGFGLMVYVGLGVSGSGFEFTVWLSGFTASVLEGCWVLKRVPKPQTQAAMQGIRHWASPEL